MITAITLQTVNDQNIYTHISQPACQDSYLTFRDATRMEGMVDQTTSTLQASILFVNIRWISTLLVATYILFLFTTVYL